jgi:hypothetical protein
MDSEDDVTQPLDPWFVLSLCMLCLLAIGLIGLKTTERCSTDFVQQIVGCKDSRHERCGATNTIEGCR